MHPRVGGVGADELEAERADAEPAGAADGVELRAGHPQRRVRLLQGLRHHVAQREMEVAAVVFAAAVLEHLQHRRDRVLPHVALVADGAAERLELGDAGALAHAELDAAVAQEIERGDALGDARRMAGGELDDAVAEPDAPGALAGGTEEHLGRGRVGIFLEEMMLDNPGVVVAVGVGEFELGERVLIELEFAVRPPRPRQLQLVEDSEFHIVRAPSLLIPTSIGPRRSDSNYPTPREIWAAAWRGTPRRLRGNPPSCAGDYSNGPRVQSRSRGRNPRYR